MIFEVISAIALAFGAGLGLVSLIRPDWAAGIVRLQADPQRPGGYSEFRATYGGFFLMLHASALVALLALPASLSVMASLPVAAAWLGAGLARLVALWRDGAKLGGRGPIPGWIATELALALAIAGPLLQLA